MIDTLLLAKEIETNASIAKLERFNEETFIQLIEPFKNILKDCLICFRRCLNVCECAPLASLDSNRCRWTVRTCRTF